VTNKSERKRIFSTRPKSSLKGSHKTFNAIILRKKNKKKHMKK